MRQKSLLLIFIDQQITSYKVHSVQWTNLFRFKFEHLPVLYFGSCFLNIAKQPQCQAGYQKSSLKVGISCTFYSRKTMSG